MHFPSKKDDWKKIEKHNVTIALNVLYARNIKICPAYVSKYSSNCEIQVILSIIPNLEKPEISPNNEQVSSKDDNGIVLQKKTYQYY